MPSRSGGPESSHRRHDTLRRSEWLRLVSRDRRRRRDLGEEARGCGDIRRPAGSAAGSLAPAACWTQGRPLPAERVGGASRQQRRGGRRRRRSRRRLAADGYVFLRGALDVGEVRAARAEVFERLVQRGRDPAPGRRGHRDRREPPGRVGRRPGRLLEVGQRRPGVAPGDPRPAASHRPRSDRRGARPRPRLHVPSRGPLGRTTGLHFDYPFFTRATERVYTDLGPAGRRPRDRRAARNRRGVAPFHRPPRGGAGVRRRLRHLAQGPGGRRLRGVRREPGLPAPDRRLPRRRRLRLRDAHAPRLARQPLAGRAGAALL